MKNLGNLLKYLKPYKKWAILAPLLIFLEVIMDLLLPSIMANVVNVGIENRDIGYIVIHLIFMIILTILGIVGGTLSAYYSAKASGYATNDLRKELFEKISGLSFFNLDKLKTGHLITIISNDITLIGSVLMLCLRFVFRVPIILVGSIIMAITISPKLSMILLALVPIMTIIVAIVMKKAFPYFQKMQDSVDDVNTVVRENLGGIRVVKAFVMEDYEIKRFKDVNQKLMDVTVKGTRIMITAMPIVMLFIHIATVLVLWFGGIEVNLGTLKIGDIMAFIEYLTSILTALMMASMVIVMLSRSEASALRINEIFELEDDLKDGKQSLSLEHMNGKLEFRNVSFAYGNGTGDAVLKNISFVANPGEMIGIIGGTGSGKSTMVNLIPRFYDVSSGEILIDDINIKDYSLKFVRKNVSIALQKPFLFSKSIRYNLAYGNDSATEENLMMGAHMACADEFIKEKGMDYILEQRGVNLSGGQKQRLSLARALIANPKILILDDTLSAVDMKTDHQIRTNLKPFLKDRTTIIVASKIASIMEADRILVLEDGTLIAEGTHEELLKKCTFYKELYQSQLQKGENYE